MPFTFSVDGYEDKAYVYVFCDGNAVHAAAEYKRRSPNRTIPTRGVFTGLYETLRDNGTLTGVRLTADREVNQGIDKQENIVQMVKCSPYGSMRRTARRFDSPHKEDAEQSMQLTCTHITFCERNTPDLAIFLRGWNFAAYSMAISGCFVTATLLNMRNLNTTVPKYKQFSFVVR
jgi:hypothetical protein